ncbi:MAG: hypothetical protein GX357_00700 [Firmicutes bacterium]|nr:hypothetical protein [Bacillota bacterium]
MEGKELKVMQLEECENLLKQIRDVISVSIVLDEHNQIEEIHVLAEDNRSAKQLVRDIETLLRVEYGIELDHKKISIVQLNQKQRSIQSRRLKFSAVSYTIQENRLEAIVELAAGQQAYQGRTSGPNSRHNSLRLFAEATIEAVKCFLPEEMTILLEDVAAYPLGRQTVVSVAVTFIQGSSEEYLVGSAVVRQEEKEAVVRATLDATNRRVPLEI